MSFQSLAISLNGKPRVIAGPILRKVTPQRVSVWLALREPCSVTLKVMDESGKLAMQGSRDTVAIGVNLHLVLVTAKKRPLDPDLLEGNVYRYDLAFDFPQATPPATGVTLSAATENALLAYPPFSLPTFCIPPRDVNSLRLLQGSCRMPHAEGKDTFPILDDVLLRAAANPFARPQQLFLTGDQIYADDVGDTLLLMLTDAADTLLGWPEVLPIQNLLASQMPPYWREKPLKDAGLTSEDLRSHLLSLGEYLAMYLFVWSDVLWPAPSGQPTIEELFARIDQGAPQVMLQKNPKALAKVRKDAESRRDTIVRDIRSIADFHNTLPLVRRVLANIPSYMIFDDHEVTDDWNMTRDYCQDLYGKPPGLRIVRNALIAYALCQHWGNAPEQFLDAPGPTPGADLLNLLDTKNPAQAHAFDGKAAALEQKESTLQSILGYHHDDVLKTKRHAGLFHEPHSFRYHYTVEGSGHQVIVTDTRTWRSFPYGGEHAPLILPKPQFTEQIVKTPDTGERVLLVVVSTNAPPVEPIRTAARNAGIARRFERHADVFEAWEMPETGVYAGSDDPSMCIDRLLKACTDKLPVKELPANAGRAHVGEVVLLSGDVHFSFASRLIYRATNRFEDTSPRRATAVFAQLVASSFKKETQDTRGFHREGYTYGPPFSETFIRAHRPEGFVGWNVSAKTKVGRLEKRFVRISPAGPQTIDFNQPLEPGRPTTLSSELMSIDAFGLSGAQPGTTFTFLHLDVAPHYRYRLDYLLPSQHLLESGGSPVAPPVQGSTALQRRQAAQAFHAATFKYRVYNGAEQPKVVGVNNCGEITFSGFPGRNRTVNHLLRWWSRVLAGKVTETIYTVSLDPDDTAFPDLKAKKEP